MLISADRLEPEEYAALYGCDPCYDKAPRLPGDGYMFYNFAVEQDPDFLRKFIPAIERTIEGMEFATTDREELGELLEYVQNLLEEKINVYA